MSTADLRRELHAFLDKLVDAIESKPNAEYYDQSNSPLGRDRHCRLVKSGALKGIKEGRRIMVLRADVEAYLARRAVIKVDERASVDREAARIIATMNRRSA